MKRCSTCNRTYTDPNLSFCIDDGTPLTVVPEDESTVVTPRADNDWNAPYRPPGTYVPPGTPPGKRRVWPWVLGIAGAFLLGIIAISIAAAILAPRLMRNDRQNSNVATANVNRSENTNVNRSENSNVVEPPPTNHDQVLAQLTDLENEWTIANLNADKQKLDRILADDYVGPASEEGGLQSKAEYIRTIQRDSEVDKWEFKDLKLRLSGDRATLWGNITYVTQGDERIYDFRDKFVWRDGRWQATGSEIKRRE